MSQDIPKSELTDERHDDRVHEQQCLAVAIAINHDGTDGDTQDVPDVARLGQCTLPCRSELVVIEAGIPLTKVLPRSARVFSELYSPFDTGTDWHRLRRKCRRLP